jgi:tetratricopeptide (TPR) repeat protein
MRARLADHLGRGETALGDARQAYLLEPERAGLADFLLSLHARYGETTESIAELESVLSAPDAWAGATAVRSAQQTLLLSRLHLLSGEDEKAIAVLERANIAHPGASAIQSQLAYLLASSERDLRRSLSLARQAQRGTPRDPAAADTLSFVYLRMGRNELALDSARLAIALAPSPQALYHYHESLALQALGRSREALTAINAVLSLSPDYPGAAVMRAKLESSRGSGDPAAS